ncbi:MAG: tRNA threonylcarbamoyladenosine dehydratase [Hydrogenophilales bacterium CG03_land_8_20_14_0_80_62_28]|nr:tRNA threonylcarbamoyladenosine dehydratase [Betaproteobacteria bacterium]OIO77713.1 MAG: tRNA threonylcarbamoyladenosine dehydratase [Hydrogenophilaceae bacterium CG1_02_62_390]PIV24692.1 MAG: tRNA threonylcarbamoyladenosine dehydratase [Hydrogenophilales bacterium CG03_land_8_20_14_0_80_62_28]PIW38534.1 MAG: tRNA threonylcarbamoyladenosine dehydratase [Hydrogenophilales bacterium CG15_BIG_FIL_POST_REV_8_21_14_020_62_31]PIW71285.1 MAG: tRNA threonylcarbamoyladenosine dehydratase [Hydrogenop
MTAVPDQFERAAILIGEEGVARLAARHVFLAGLGGVGSWCAEALARAGVGRLTLVDMDTVAVSNINRQMPALFSTVGRKKTEVMAERVLDINPNCGLTILDTFIDPDNVDGLLAADTDFVVDCIDSLNCKVALIATAYRRAIPVAASMGAGNKLDPSRIKLADISKTQVCPLAREVRHRLKRQGIETGILTVYSDESGRPPRPPEATSHGRARAVNGTISYLPPLFGLMLAGAVIQRLLVTDCSQK